MALKPNQEVPELALPTAGGSIFDLTAVHPRTFTMLVFYRGLHCPICKTYLRDLNDKMEQFGTLGVESVAVTSDGKDRAEQAKSEWGLDKIPMAYDLSIDQGRSWGLFVSRGIKESEPTLFVEPGLFLVRPDRTLYAASIQTMPFARPQFSDIFGAVSFVTKNNYPARGEA